MRHIITYNEAAQGAYFRRVDRRDAERRLKSLGDDYFLHGEVEKMIRKAAEFGWEGKLVERGFSWGAGWCLKSFLGFSIFGDLLRTTELPSGERIACHPRRQANQVCLSVYPPEFSFNILKSVDDYFFVELVEETDDLDGNGIIDEVSHYVCDGIDGVIALMESIESRKKA